MVSAAKRRVEITVMLPTYNEEASLPRIVPEYLEILRCIPGAHEVLIVDDGSTDGTRRVADSLHKRFPSVRAIHHEKNLGYGAAQKTGFKNAKGRLIFFNSADGQIPPRTLSTYIEALESNDIVIGHYIQRSDPVVRLIISKCYSVAMLLLFGLPFRTIGAPKLYRREVVESLSIDSSSGFFDGELLVRARAAGFRIAQVDIECLPRQGGRSSQTLRPILRAAREVILFRIRKWSL